MNTNLNQTATLSRRSLTTRRITFDALFAALYVVFACLISIKASIVEISFASFPVIFSAFLLGPVDAVLVALVGSFIEQCMTFGLTATTPLWMKRPSAERWVSFTSKTRLSAVMRPVSPTWPPISA